MDNNDSLVLCFFGALATIVITLSLLFVPGCVAVDTCLKNTDPAKAVLCERIIQQQYPIKTEYPNDEKTAR